MDKVQRSRHSAFDHVAGFDSSTDITPGKKPNETRRVRVFEQDVLLHTVPPSVELSLPAKAVLAIKQWANDFVSMVKRVFKALSAFILLPFKEPEEKQTEKIDLQKIKRGEGTPDILIRQLNHLEINNPLLLEKIYIEVGKARSRKSQEEEDAKIKKLQQEGGITNWTSIKLQKVWGFTHKTVSNRMYSNEKDKFKNQGEAYLRSSSKEENCKTDGFYKKHVDEFAGVITKILEKQD